MPPAEPAVAARGLSRRFGPRWVLREVSLDVAPGDVLLLVGHNGAGKTTLLRILAGLSRPTRGEVARRAAVGMVAHHSMLYDALTARENLAFFARLHGLAARERTAALLERLGLDAVADERVATFSRGMVQRLAIARALLHDPAVLLLDEPLNGLDESATGTVLQVLEERRAQGGAAVVASHQFAELVGLASRIAYLVKGRLAADEPLDGRDAAAVLHRYRALARAG